MEVLYEVRGRNLLIYLPEELDHHNAKIITEQSDWYIISNKIQNIIFNFKRTKFMDSSGIGVIMGRYKLVKNRGGKVTVTNINNSIDRILTISGWYKSVEKMENNMSITFDAKSQNESLARMVVAAFLTEVDPTIEEINDIKTAVSEAVTNAIIHGYGEKTGTVYMKCNMLTNKIKKNDSTYETDTTIKIEIKDEGVGIENIEKAREPLFTTKPELERSGMGFMFMEMFMDELIVESEKGRGTKVSMTKRLTKQEKI